MKRIGAWPWIIGAVLPCLLTLPGCNAVNPLCGSARPAPVIGTLSASSITFAQVQQGYVLTVNGSHFVSASVVIVNGKTLSTAVTSSTQMHATLTTSVITAPGNAHVSVTTPSGNSGDLGCSSGGSTSALVLTVS